MAISNIRLIWFVPLALVFAIALGNIRSADEDWKQDRVQSARRSAFFISVVRKQRNKKCRRRKKKSNNTEHKEHDIKHASEGILMLLLLLLYFVVFVNPLEQRILTFLLLRITLK